MANNITDEEITRLAREYAEEVCADTSTPFKDDVICEEIENAESFLRFLLRSHCLVEKSKLVRRYKIEADAVKNLEVKAKTSFKNWVRSSIYQYKAECERTMRLLESLFGDTLKEEGGENGED